MTYNPIAFAVPVFLILIALEVWVAWRRGARVYRLNDALSDLGCGVAQQVREILIGALLLIPYVWLYEHARLFDLPAWVGWILGILGYDLGYYAYHRFSHRSNLGWASHVVHHQSEDYNLAVALRQSMFAGLVGWPFYLPLAILGVDPFTYAVCASVNLLYQFWIHTQLIDRLGPLEWVLNTPSHHRLHHGCDPRSIDTNYAGMFILWDRMFGTFRPEEHRPTYGALRPLRSWNPIWANIEPIVAIWREAARAPRWRDRLWIWFAPPEWHPAVPGQEAPVAVAGGPGFGYNADNPAAHPYVVAQLGGVIAALTLLLLYQPSLGWGWVLAGSAWIYLSLLIIGGLTERKPWALPLEMARLFAMGLLPGLAAAQGHPVPGGAALVWAFAGWAALSLGGLRLRPPLDTPPPSL